MTEQRENDPRDLGKPSDRGKRVERVERVEREGKGEGEAQERKDVGILQRQAIFVVRRRVRRERRVGVIENTPTTANR